MGLIGRRPVHSGSRSVCVTTELDTQIQDALCASAGAAHHLFVPTASGILLRCALVVVLVICASGCATAAVLGMAQSSEGWEPRRNFVPQWDGNPTSWRRYKDEVRVWLLAERTDNISYSLAARLIQRLTGAARRVAFGHAGLRAHGGSGRRSHRRGAGYTSRCEGWSSTIAWPTRSSAHPRGVHTQRRVDVGVLFDTPIPSTNGRTHVGVRSEI